jgi:hypothetical protein
MGNNQSSPPPPPPPQPGPPVPVVTLPLQKVPVQDGASGLHYSGRVYTNQFSKLSADLCNGTTASVDQIADLFPNGVSSTDLPIDDSTHRISTTALQGYVNNLEQTGLVPGQLPSFDEQATADKSFYVAVQGEYCFYEARYSAALTQFMALVADPRGADPNATQSILNQTIALNKRLNSLLEIIHYVGNERARKVNARSSKIEKANAEIQEKLAILSQQKDFLQSSEVRTRTQEEMIRYSSEKGRAMNIQIMFFVALNVVALGTILTVYSQTAPSV